MTRTHATPRQTQLDRAASHLGARCIGDGRWAHYDDGPERWYVVDEDDLIALCDYMDDADEDPSASRPNVAYSHWCAAIRADRMPRGWEPGNPEGEVTSYKLGRGRRD